MRSVAASAAAVLAVGGCGVQEWSLDAEGGVSSAAHPVCSSDNQCGLARLHCDPGSGECVACVDDSQCVEPGSKRCDPTLNRCVPCELDSDCYPGEVCEGFTHRCVTPCTVAGDCPSRAPICSQGLCASCTSSADCNSVNSPVCDQRIGRCVECVSDAQCGGDEVTCDRITGRCAECLNANDCAPGAFCDPLYERCVQPFADASFGGDAGTGEAARTP
jgi:hypothetical protein